MPWRVHYLEERSRGACYLHLAYSLTVHCGTACMPFTEQQVRHAACCLNTLSKQFCLLLVALEDTIQFITAKAV
jgi:hypothetical protein